MKGVQEIDEKEVLARAVQGDSDAFGELYKRYVGQIYNYVYYRTGDPFDAEDLTARVFMRAMHHIRSYRDRGLPFSAWLYRIAHNLVANWYRDNSRRQEISLEKIALSHFSADYPENVLVQTQEREIILAVIRRLPPERQQLLIMKFVERFSNAEIGQIMGRTEGAIKSLYRRTLLTLRDEVGELVEGVFVDDSDNSGG
jgi:RNA polymerase sigma-70 factor (ECF subfamily)